MIVESPLQRGFCYTYPMDIQENVSLGPLTTFQIGGQAQFLITVHSQEELEEAIIFAKAKSLPKLILGGGSNILVSDSGFEGVVIHIHLSGVELEEDTLIAGAGEQWDALVERAVTEGLWGIENLSAIPGTVGGAVVQNIGAYGAALSEVLRWAEVLDTQTGDVTRYTNEQCLFDYRNSIFKQNPDLVVLRAAFNLSREPKPNVSYKDLAALFSSPPRLGEAGSSLNLQAIREAVIGIRKGKFPDLSIEGTAGSFFKNPILPKAEADALKVQYPEMPLFAMPETAGVKVPLAWLLDHVLDLKGASVGGARLFEKQPLVIAAARNTSSNDVQELAEKVKREVKEKLHLEIEPEVKII